MSGSTGYKQVEKEWAVSLVKGEAVDLVRYLFVDEELNKGKSVIIKKDEEQFKTEEDYDKKALELLEESLFLESEESE